MSLTKEYLEELIAISDPDGIWAMMQDLELWEEAEYIEKNYFDSTPTTKKRTTNDNNNVINNN